MSRTVTSWRRTLELLGMRLDLRTISSWASGKAAKERRLSSISTRCENAMKTARCVFWEDTRNCEKL